jgi:hypothetical protein
MKLLRTLLAATLAAALPAAVSAGCSAGSDEPDPTTSAGGSAGMAATGGTGGEAGEGGGGGALPCGIDCATIETDACHLAECDLDTLACKVVNQPDGLECDDEDFCTLGDVCTEGVCAGPDPNDCGMPHGPCEEVLCDETTDTCSLGVLPDTTPCSPIDQCMLGATCQNALCIGFPNDCFFAPVPDECHVPVCNPENGDCEPQIGNEGLPCNDPNDLCTIGKTCAAGVCQGGAAKDCSTLTQGCFLGQCDPSNGQCFAQQLMDGDACDDKNACTSGELCMAGSCSGGVVQMQCMGGDACCPVGCDELTDTDCILDILLMGDDVDVVGWDTFRTALTAAGESWTERDLDVLPFPTAAELAPFNTLIWFDESTLVPGDIQCQIVADWLQSGGDKNLLAASRDFLWDVANGLNGQGEHNLYLTFGVTYAGDFAGTAIATVDGVPGDPIGGSFAPPNSLQLSMTTGSSGDWANEAMGPATHAGFYGPGGSGSTHSALGYYQGGPYKVVWLGMNFHNGLPQAAQRDQLMTNIINYFKN